MPLARGEHHAAAQPGHGHPVTQDANVDPGWDSRAG
jgi:hypothetical protein